MSETTRQKAGLKTKDNCVLNNWWLIRQNGYSFISHTDYIRLNKSINLVKTKYTKHFDITKFKLFYTFSPKAKSQSERQPDPKII